MQNSNILEMCRCQRKLSKQQQKGNRENKTEILSNDEFNILYEKNLLGTGIIILTHIMLTCLCNVDCSKTGVNTRVFYFFFHVFALK